MKSAYIDKVRLHKHTERKRRTKRLMDMKDIKTLLAQTPFSLNRQPRGYRDMSYRFIAWHREGFFHSNNICTKIGNTVLRARSKNFNPVSHQ